MHYFSAVSTFAWFQVSAQTNHDITDVESGTLKAGVTDASVGGFTFVLGGLTATEADKTVDLTDASGNSYVYTTSGTTNKMPVTPTNPTCEWSGLTWVINYSGPSDTAAKIQLEWNELISRYPTADVKVVSDAGNTHVVRFSATGAAASACDAGDYLLADDVALNTISWTSVEVSGSTNPYSASVTITTKLTAAAFATALTGTDTNEGTRADGTHGITVSTVLNAAA